MKEAFKTCMKLMYPDGLILPQEEIQFRDLVRCFSMGWIEALIAVGDINEKEINEAVEICKKIAVQGWTPDETWRWWTA